MWSMKMIFCGCVIFGCAPAPFTFYLSEMKNKESMEIYMVKTKREVERPYQLINLMS
jgi:hypothetical protein